MMVPDQAASRCTGGVSDHEENGQEPMDRDTLLERLRGREWTDFELKEGSGGVPEDAYKTVSAFANTAGGWLVFGVREQDGGFEICGLADPESVEITFIGTCRSREKLSRAIEIEASQIAVGDLQVLAFYIPQLPRFAKPLRVRVRKQWLTYVRVGSGDHRCNEVEEARFLREALEEDFDAKICEATTIESLDLEAVRWLQAQVALQRSDRSEPGEKPEEFLTELGLRREDGALTNAAALLFGRPPVIGRLQAAGIVDFRAHYHTSYREGLPANRWDDREFCDGHIIAAFRSLAARLYRLCPQPFAMESNGLQRRAYSPDYLAVREGFVNLLIHQDYSDRHRTASIQWYRDGVVFENPGDSRVAPEQLLTDGGMSVLRNSLLVRAMRQAGFSEQLGAGLRSIRRTWADAGREPPQIVNDPGLKTFRLVLPWSDLLPPGPRTADAPPPPRRDAEPTPAPKPRRDRRRQLLAGSVLAVALLLVVLIALRFCGSPTPTSVALLALGDGSTPDEAWPATVIAEIVAEDLPGQDGIRQVDRGRVAEVRRALQLRTAADLGASHERLRSYLEADWVVGISCLAGDSGLTLDLHLLSTRTGKLAPEETVSGRRDALFDLAHAAAGYVRRRLGRDRLSEAEKTAVTSLFPASPTALRHYGEGLAKLSELDRVGARRAFETAIAEEPENARLHLALAGVLSDLGYAGKARDAAAKARKHSAELPLRERLGIEAYFHELEGNPQAAVDALRRLFDESGELEPGLDLARMQITTGAYAEALGTVAALRQLPGSTVRDALVDLVAAEVHFRRNEFETALELIGDAIDQSRRLESPSLEAPARLDRARVLEYQGDYRAALEDLEQARILYAKIDDRKGLLEAFHQMAVVFLQLGRLEEARARFAEVRDFYQQRNDAFGEALASTNLANVLMDLGEIDEARTLTERAMSIFEDLGMRIEQAHVARNLGVALHLAGRLSEARTRYEQALLLFQELDDRYQQANVLANLGELDYQAGDLEGALERYREALEQHRGNPSGEAYDHFLLGEVQAARGVIAEARSSFDQAVELQEELGEVVAAAETRLARAQMELHLRNVEIARNLAEESERLFREVGMVDLAVLARVVRAETLLPDVAQARAVVELAALHARESQEPRVRFAVAILAARLDVRESPEDGGAVDAALAALADVARDSEPIHQGYFFEARLAMADVELVAGRESAARERLGALVEDAERVGWNLVARRAQQMTALS